MAAIRANTPGWLAMCVLATIAAPDLRAQTVDRPLSTG
jgi:hypothetical protein